MWAPAERIISGVQRLTNQLNGVLFPVIVDSDAAQQQRTAAADPAQGTRLSLAMVVPIAAALIVLADPLVHAWLGRNADKVAGCIPVLQILAVAVAFRVGNATGNTLLKGAGEHRLRRVGEPRHRGGQRRCSASLLIKPSACPASPRAR